MVGVATDIGVEVGWCGRLAGFILTEAAGELGAAAGVIFAGWIGAAGCGWRLG